MKVLPLGAKRVVRCGMSHTDSCRFLAEINFWLSNSGPEWTSDRLKAIRQAAYQLRAGNAAGAIRIYQNQSISYNHHSLFPYGMFGVVVRGYVSAMKPSVIRKYDALLRVYTCIKLDSLSQRQFSKAKAAINEPLHLDESESFDLKSFEIAIEKIASKWKEKLRNPIGRDGLVVIDLSCFSPWTSTHIEKKCLEGSPLADQSWGKHISSLWTSVWIPDSLKGINPAEKLRGLLEKSGAQETTAGHIAFLQEGGCKGRVIAVPNCWVQLLMQPLHASLDALSKQTLQSVVHDQNQGAYFAKKCYENGQTLTCKDLSSATDRFPRSLQTALLKGLGLSVYAKALEEISKAPWIVDTRINGSFVTETWSYSVGQPMGLYSSFPLFNLTHVAFLQCLSNMCGGDFKVLGDDVIIFGKTLAREYTKWLIRFGVQFSEPKCMESDSVAEFAGFTIYKTNKGITSHRPFKYSGRHGLGAAMPLLNSFGSGVKVLGKWYTDRLLEFNFTRGFRNPDLSPLFRLKTDYEDDLQPLKSVTRLNSHRLGSLGNVISYSLRYEPSADLYDCYEAQQIILLGQKEIVSEGFASANANTLFSPGSNPDEHKSIGDSEMDRLYHVSLSSDSLMNQIKKTGSILGESSAFSRLKP